jgi:hypothetical protein
MHATAIMDERPQTHPSQADLLGANPMLAKDLGQRIRKITVDVFQGPANTSA